METRLSIFALWPRAGCNWDLGIQYSIGFSGVGEVYDTIGPWDSDQWRWWDTNYAWLIGTVETSKDCGFSLHLPKFEYPEELMISTGAPWPVTYIPFGLQLDSRVIHFNHGIFCTAIKSRESPLTLWKWTSTTLSFPSRSITIALTYQKTHIDILVLLIRIGTILYFPFDQGEQCFGCTTFFFPRLV